MTIDGSNLENATDVSFNSIEATVCYDTATEIDADVPTNATTGDISVTTVAGTATSSTDFTVIQPPVITGFSPTSGPVGTDGHY